MLLIVMLGIDVFKSIIGNEEVMQKNIKIMGKRLMYAVVIFLVPTITNFTINIVEEVTGNIKNDYNKCLENANNIEYFEELTNIEQEREDQEIKLKLEEAKQKLNEEKIIAKKYSKVSKSQTESQSSAGKFTGQKYNTLSEEQIRGIAMKCQREQGSPVGAAAEASQMANRYELYYKKYGYSGDPNKLYDFVADCGWWGSSARSIMSNTSSLKPEILAAVKQVLVNGKRTLPPYIDEHDCIDCGAYGYDINKIVVNGKTITSHSELKNRANYIKDKTILYNVYGGHYTFYTFPTETSDPFGYTDEAYRIINP